MDEPREQYIYIYDAYVRIWANSKEEADEKLQVIEATIDAVPTASLQLFDAYGIEDAHSGLELRQVH